MKRLTDKYEIIEEITKDNKKMYKAKDHFNNIEVFLEIHQEVANSDWDMGAKVNDELRKLRLSEKIDDYFYYPNQEKKTKIFFKVYKDEVKEVIKKTRKRNRVAKVEKSYEAEEESTLASSDKQEEVSYNRPANFNNLERVMVCEKCRTEVNLRNFNNLTNTTFCDVCKSEKKIIFQEKASKKEEAEMSRYIEVENGEDNLIIKISKSKIGMILILLALIPIAAYLLADAEYLFETLEIYIIIGVATVLFVMILDKTYIEVRDGVLLSYSKPFSTTKTQKYPIRDIKQLYVSKQIAEGASNKTRLRIRNGRAYNEEYYQDAQIDVYNLIVILKDEAQISIFETYNSADALYLEKTLEKYLGIKDVAVRKEI